MLETKGIAYPTRFANHQKNSCASVNVSATGKTLWSKSFTDVLPGSHLSPRDVLVSGTHIGVRSADDLLLFLADGSFQKHLPVGHNIMAVLGKEAYAYTKPSFLLEHRNYAGELQLEMSEFPYLQEYATTLLFRPTHNDILAAVQFMGGPEKFPKQYDVFSKPVLNAHSDWHYGSEGVLDQALLTPDETAIVLIRGTGVTVIDAAKGTETSGFKVSMEEIKAASLSLEGNLVLVGEQVVEEERRFVLAMVNLSGATVWSYELTAYCGNQPPVCGPEGRVYVADEGWLKCIKDGEPEWLAEFVPSGFFWMTATADGQVVALVDKHLYLFDNEGVAVFNIEVTAETEEFYAPPAIDKAGRIYVAGTKNLYCFQ